MVDADRTAELIEAVARALDGGGPLRVRGAGTRPSPGGAVTGEPLSVAGHCGVLSYEPSELVIRVRAGTPIAELDAALAEAGQMLPFEPPRFAPQSTIGGAVASAMSGPRRPYAGAIRDFVLGVTVINGRGERLSFGGQVMKNVAGYDIARLMTGSRGILGIILDVSLKVLPAPRVLRTLRFECNPQEAVTAINRHAGRPLPLSAACWHDGVLRLRLEGSQKGVEAARRSLGGDEDDDGDSFWRQLRDHELGFFAAGRLARLSVPPAAPLADYGGAIVIDWGGAQRWVADSGLDDARLAAEAARAGGHAVLFRDRARGTGDLPLAPLPEVAMTLHRRLKGAFDPHNLFNPGRMFADL